MGLANLPEAARAHGLERIVYASSVALFGPGTMYREPVTEDAPYFSTNLYGATKAMNEATARHYAKLYAIDALGLRPHFSFGPGRYDGAAGQFSSLIKACSAGSVSRWNRVFKPGTLLAPLHADDMAGAFVHALYCPRLPDSIYNVGGHYSFPRTRWCRRLVD